MSPGFVRSPTGAHLGDDHQAVRIGVQRLLDNLICYVRTIEVAGIYVVHAGFHGLLQDTDCFAGIARWSPHLRTSELHRAITHDGSRSAKTWGV